MNTLGRRALLALALMSCAPHGAVAQLIPDGAFNGSHAYRQTAPTVMINPLCPNGGVNGVPALGVAGPGVVGQNYIGTVCPAPGLPAGSGAATVTGQDGVNPVSATNPLPTNSTKQTQFLLSSATATGGNPTTTSPLTLTGGDYSSGCSATAWNGATVLRYYLGLDQASWLSTGWGCAANGPMTNANGSTVTMQTYAAGTQVHDVLTPASASAVPVSVTTSIGQFH